MSAADYSALPRHEIALVIGGTAYMGWTSVEVNLGIDALCGAFQLELASRDKTGDATFPIAPGDACAVVLAGKPLITGFIDVVNRDLAKEDRVLSVSGRDKACDLVDCAALNSPGSWRSVSLATIARELAEPFGVTITVTGDVGKPLSRFAIQPGETAFAAIERLCRYRGLIAFSDGQGGVVIGNPDSGARAGAVREGENIVSLGSRSDHSQRFSSYVVKGQASGSDQRNGKTVAQVKGSAEDGAVKRFRPMLVIGEEQSDAASLAARAKWEQQTRAGRSESHRAVVPGWLTGTADAPGAPWAPGARVHCQAPSHNLDRDLLLERVVFRRGEDGTTSELTLVPPEAWAQLAQSERSAA